MTTEANKSDRNQQRLQVFVVTVSFPYPLQLRYGFTLFKTPRLTQQ
jgi:hypothetical protein